LGEIYMKLASAGGGDVNEKKVGTRRILVKNDKTWRDQKKKGGMQERNDPVGNMQR